MLAEYLRSSGRRGYELADELGVKPPNVSRFIKGKQRPTLDQAFIIERFTDGAIPASAWARAHPAATASE